MKYLITALVFMVLATGCSNLGSGAIEGSRTDYNMALRRTDDEQMLLNLVRLRYRDRPLYLEVSALNTQFTFTGAAEVGTEFGDVDDLYGVRGGVVVEEKPTVTYTPLQGGEFVEQVLTPIHMETLFLLFTSGWSTERVFRTLLREMNDVKNAPGASGPTPERAPQFRQFIRAAGLLNSLENQDLINGARRGDELLLRFRDAVSALPEYRELTELLGLDPDRREFVVNDLVRGSRSDTINFRFRSFAGVMYFLSQSVEVPQADIDAGRVTLTRDAAGQVFDWGQVTDGLMRVRSSEERPANAAVAVNYRDSWFYIDDSDLDSKSTFSMLGQIFALQSGNVKSMTPVLTIPVGN